MWFISLVVRHVLVKSEILLDVGLDLSWSSRNIQTFFQLRAIATHYPLDWPDAPLASTDVKSLQWNAVGKIRWDHPSLWESRFECDRHNSDINVFLPFWHVMCATCISTRNNLSIIFFVNEIRHLIDGHTKTTRYPLEKADLGLRYPSRFASSSLLWLKQFTSWLFLFSTTWD